MSSQDTNEARRDRILAEQFAPPPTEYGSPRYFIGELLRLVAAVMGDESAGRRDGGARRKRAA